MPEQNQGYMAELDQWTQGAILDPLYAAWGDVEHAPDEVLDELRADLTRVVSEVKRAIREKVLESYRNGQQAQERKPAASRPYANRRPQYKRGQ